jgi:hypothetical protein
MTDNLEELTQLHKYTRTNLQLIVQWWIFFVTANYVVLGLFASKMSEGGLRSRLPAYIASAVFSSVNLGSFWFCLRARKWFDLVGKAVANLRVSPRASQPPGAILLENPFPHAEYAQLMLAMTLTISLMFLTWVLFASAVANLQPHAVHYPGSPTLVSAGSS